MARQQIPPQSFIDQYPILKKAGYSDTEIVKHLFISYPTLQHWKKKAGIKLKRIDGHNWIVDVEASYQRPKRKWERGSSKKVQKF